MLVCLGGVTFNIWVIRLLCSFSNDLASLFPPRYIDDRLTGDEDEADGNDDDDDDDDDDFLGDGLVAINLLLLLSSRSSSPPIVNVAIKLIGLVVVVCYYCKKIST
jgi:hypothetical protein